MQYAIVIEQSSTGFGAYAPDLPGCGVTGSTFEETVRLIREAIEFHIEGLKLQGLPVPPPTTRTDYVEVTI